jgi:hypothetical protein
MTTIRAAGGLLLLTTIAACSQAATPTSAYVTYRKAFDQSKSIDDLAPYMDKATLARVAAAPAKEKQGFFLMMKAFSEIVDLKVVKETVSGEQAVLEATGLNVAMGGDSRATVQMVKEGDVWKVQKESWGNDASAPKPPERTCPQLTADLQGTAVGPRARAAAALLQKTCADAVPNLVALLGDPSLGIRANAAGALRNSMREVAGDKTAHLPAIVAAKKSAAAIEDTTTEVNLQGTLWTMGAPAVPHLVADLKHASRDMRWGAAAGLGMMGAAAKDALPALQAAAKDEKDQTVADRMSEAIKEVQGS